MDPGRLWDASGRPLDGRSCPGSVRPLAGLDALGPQHMLAVSRIWICNGPVSQVFSPSGEHL